MLLYKYNKHEIYKILKLRFATYIHNSSENAILDTEDYKSKVIYETVPNLYLLWFIEPNLSISEIEQLFTKVNNDVQNTFTL